MNSSDSYDHSGGSFKTWLLGGSDRGRKWYVALLIARSERCVKLL